MPMSARTMFRGDALEVRDRLIAIADRDDHDILVGKGQLDDALYRDAVVGIGAGYGLETSASDFHFNF
jgi:hypothetical protein